MVFTPTTTTTTKGRQGRPSFHWYHRHLLATLFRRRMTASKRSGQLRYAFDCLVLLCCTQTLVISYERAHHFSLGLWRYSLEEYFLYMNRARYNPFLPVIVFLLQLYNFSIQHQLWFGIRPRGVAWRALYELTAANQRSYHRHRLSRAEIQLAVARQRQRLMTTGRIRSDQKFRSCFCWPEFVLHWQAKLLIWSRFEHVNTRAMLAERFRYYQVSDRQRLKLLVVMGAWDTLSLVVQIAIDFGVICFTWHITSEIFTTGNHHFAWYSYVWYTLDFVGVWHCLRQLIHSVMFFIGCLTIEITFHTDHLAAQLRQLTTLVRLYVATGFGGRGTCHQSHAPKWLPPTLDQAVGSFVRNHIRMANNVHHTERGLYGPLLLVYLVTNVPVNVFLVGQLTFGRLSLVDRAVFLLALAIQTVVAGGAIAHLAWFSVRMRQPLIQSVPALQWTLVGRRWIRAKLQLDDLLKRTLVGRPQIAVSIGTLKQVTPLVGFELISLYVVYILMVFADNRKLKMEHLN